MSQIYYYETNFMYGKNGTTGQYKYIATIELNSQNQQANKSNITATLSLVSNTNTQTKMWDAQAEKNQPYATLSGSVSATGNRISVYKKSTTPLTLVTWTGDIAHNNDGTKSITVKFDWVEGQLVYYPASFTVATATVALPTIQRAGEISVGSKTIQSASDTLPYTITSRGNYWFKLVAAVSYTYNGSTQTSSFNVLNGQYITSTYSGTIDCGDLLDRLPVTTSGTLTLTLTAYSNSAMTSSVGTKTATSSLAINTNSVKPTVSIGTITINTTPISSTIVAGYTTLTIPYTTAKPRGTTGLTNTITASKGSVATSTTTVVGNGSVNTNAMAASTTDYTVTYTITSKDSRGATATTTKNVSVKGYTAPQISIQAYRCTSGGVQDDADVYVKATYSVVYSLTGQGNVGTDSITKDGSAYTAGTIVSLSEQNSAVFLVTATDNVGTVTKSVTVGPALMPLDLYDDGTAQHLGVGLAGATAEADKVKAGKNMYVEATSGWVGVRAGRTDTGISVDLQAGSGGANHGIWTAGYNDGTFHSDGKWMVYRDANGNIILNGNATTATTATNATNASKLATWPSKRPASATGNSTWDASMTHFLSTNTTTDRPQDNFGYITDWQWDNNNGILGTQMYIACNQDVKQPIAMRGSSSNVWNTWNYVPTYKELWTGTCQGGSSVSLSLGNNYRFIRVYVSLFKVDFYVDVDLTHKPNKTVAAGSSNTAYRGSSSAPVYATAASTQRAEIFYCVVEVNSAKTSVSILQMGYIYSSGSRQDRNSNADYFAYKIEGYL